MIFSLSKRRRTAKLARTTRKGIPAFFLILVTVLLLLCTSSAVLRRQLETAAEESAVTMLSDAVATSLSEAFCDREGLYAGIVVITRDADGVITSVGTDPGALSSLSAVFLAKLQKTVSESGKVSIPLGNLTGSAWLSGRGVPITFRTVLSRGIVTGIRSEFVSVGINQTLHRVILETSATVTVLLPGRNVTQEVTYSFPAAETVIVGRVPELYLNPDH